MKITDRIKNLYKVIHAGLNVKHLQINARMKTLSGLLFPIWISTVVPDEALLFLVSSETYIQLFQSFASSNGSVFNTHTHISK